MIVYNLIGRRRRHDVNDADPLLVEYLLVSPFLLQFKLSYQIVHQFLGRKEGKYKQWTSFFLMCIEVQTTLGL